MGEDASDREEIAEAPVEEAVQEGVDMVLCGHTHNGQVFPGNIIIALTEYNNVSPCISAVLAFISTSKHPFSSLRKTFPLSPANV